MGVQWVGQTSVISLAPTIAALAESGGTPWPGANLLRPHEERVLRLGHLRFGED